MRGRDVARRSLRVATLAIAALGCSDAVRDLPDGCTVGPVQVATGELCGTRLSVASRSVDVFRGVPYGESTAGANRWQPPVPKAPWQGILPAIDYGDICPQVVPSYPSPPPSEDCLSLNLWRPTGTDRDAKLPVMVFIHGGGFEDGSGSIPLYSGASLSASQDAIVVTINYRLGALGFLSGYGGLSGNYGLLDQQLALRWVQDNVAGFGGDPRSVLLYGESAGAMSTGLHMLSIPSSAGLFSAALMESNPLGLPYKSLSVAAEFGAALAKVLGCADLGLDCLRSLPAQQIADAQDDPSITAEGLLQGFSGFLLWAPALDGTLVTEQPVTAAARGLPLPTVLGTNRDEGTLFVYPLLEALHLLPLSADTYAALVAEFFGATDVGPILAAYPPSGEDNAPVVSQLASDYLFFCASRSLASGGGSPVYAYFFSQLTNFNLWGLYPPLVPQCADQVCHGAELPYAFNSASDILQLFTPDEEALSQAIGDYWGAFSRPGHDPNPAEANRPRWPSFADARSYLVLDTPIGTVVDPPHHCDLWDELGYVLIKPEALLRGATAAAATGAATATHDGSAT
jgi:acetylcholinesterase/cholinesterase